MRGVGLNQVNNRQQCRFDLTMPVASGAVSATLYGADLKNADRHTVDSDGANVVDDNGNYVYRTRLGTFITGTSGQNISGTSVVSGGSLISGAFFVLTTDIVGSGITPLASTSGTTQCVLAFRNGKMMEHLTGSISGATSVSSNAEDTVGCFNLGAKVGGCITLNIAPVNDGNDNRIYENDEIVVQVVPVSNLASVSDSGSGAAGVDRLATICEEINAKDVVWCNYSVSGVAGQLIANITPLNP
jgi:hypothetical protein